MKTRASYKSLFTPKLGLRVAGLANNNSNTTLPSKTTRYDDDGSKLRILYIVTSSNAKYYHTRQGKDRLDDFVLPVILDAVESLLEDYHVDLYLILSYPMDPSKEETLRQMLPASVGLQIWTEAAPVKYSCDYDSTNLCWGIKGKRGGMQVPADQAVLATGRTQLARQHRYVVKDKLPYYDYFMAFEDDMRITKHHFQQHVQVMAQLRTLAKLAPTTIPTSPENNDFWGTLTKDQIEHMRPGFLRVEVLTDASFQIPHNEDLRTIPVDSSFTRQNHNGTYDGPIDPAPCCRNTSHVGRQGTSLARHRPFPNSSDLVLWETAAKAMSVRKMPPSSSTTLDWVMLFPVIPLWKRSIIPHFWAGNAAIPSNKKRLHRPRPENPKLIAQTAGWMASRQEILDLDGYCLGGFLPPFDTPRDGLDNNVEFWSGGIQMSCECNVQRILPLGDPDAISRHLLYHTTNVKQLQVQVVKRLVRINDFMGQMTTVQKVAQRKMQEIRQSRKLLLK